MNQLGYYGKTAHRGDFVRFNLPQSFITVWDDWLRDIMIQGELQHTDWRERYAAAPAYRFVLSAGIAGNTPWLGVLLPSADKVGRRFPFCLAVSLPENAMPVLSLLSSNDWFVDAEQLLHTVQASDYVFDELQADLGQLAERHAQTQPAMCHQLAQTEPAVDEHFTICVTPASTLPSDLPPGQLPAVPAPAQAPGQSPIRWTSQSSTLALAPMLDTVLQQCASEYSLWQATGNTGRLILSSGLPTQASGVALMTEDWQSATSALIDLTALIPDSPQESPALVDASSDASAAALSFGTADRANSPDSADQNTDADALSMIGVAPTVNTGGSRTEPAHGDPGSNEKDRTIQAATSVADVSGDADGQIPSADDWAALDDFSGSDDQFDEVIVPEVEPLELEEDDLPDAPWEK